MAREIPINTDKRGFRSDIRYFAGEAIVFSVENRPIGSTIVFTAGADLEAPPEIQKPGYDLLALTASELEIMGEGAHWEYNLWLETDGERDLLRHGSFTSLASLEPVDLVIVADPLVLTGTAPGPVDVGTPYLFAPGVSGGTQPLTFALVGGLPAGLSFDTATGVISGIPTAAATATGLILRVSDAAGQTEEIGPFSIQAIAIAQPEGIAMVWRWGQSNEGSLGNNPSTAAPAYRGAFDSIRQIDNVTNRLGPDEPYALIPYAILATGDDAVEIDGQTITAPQGEYTLIADQVAVGPTFGMATAIRDERLFQSASETWFWKASAAGRSLAYFMPRGDEAPYAAGDTNIWNGWRYKCYANRQLRAELAAATEPVYLQCAGDWQGEADVTNAAGDPSSPYITQYADEHAKIYRSDSEVLGSEPPYFKIALRRVAGPNQAVTDALNAEMAQMCRYRVDLAGAITDTGSGHDRLYLVDHGFSGVASGQTDPHVDADEQRRIGEAIATALVTLHGGDGFTTAYPLTEVKPQISGVTATLQSTDLVLGGFHSDPGTLTVRCEDTAGALLAERSLTLTDTLAGQAAFTITVPGMPTGQEIRWTASLTIATGETAVPRSGTVEITAATVDRRWDDTFNPGDFTYGETFSAGDTATRLDSVGARYPRAIPASGSGQIYFEISSAGGLLFAGIGTPSSPQNGGPNGVMRAGILNANIQHTGGSVAAGVDLSQAQVIRVAVDVDQGLMWIRSSDMIDWNATAGADPATGAGGLDISGLDTTAIVPMAGVPSRATGVEAVLRAVATDWVHAAPAGFEPIG